MLRALCVFAIFAPLREKISLPVVNFPSFCPEIRSNNQEVSLE